MKILVIHDDGTLVGQIEHFEEYNLGRPAARAELLDELHDLQLEGMPKISEEKSHDE